MELDILVVIFHLANVTGQGTAHLVRCTLDPLVGAVHFRNSFRIAETWNQPRQHQANIVISMPRNTVVVSSANLFLSRIEYIAFARRLVLSARVKNRAKPNQVRM